jgi:hypothetical protein
MCCGCSEGAYVLVAGAQGAEEATQAAGVRRGAPGGDTVGRVRVLGVPPGHRASQRYPCLNSGHRLSRAHTLVRL